MLKLFIVLGIIFSILFLLRLIIETKNKRNKKRLSEEFKNPKTLSKEESETLLEILDHKDKKILLRGFEIDEKAFSHWLLTKEEHWYDASQIPERVIIISPNEEKNKDVCGITFTVGSNNDLFFTRFRINKNNRKIIYH